MQSVATSEGNHKSAGRKLNVVLWIIQGLLALLFLDTVWAASPRCLHLLFPWSGTEDVRSSDFTSTNGAQFAA